MNDALFPRPGHTALLVVDVQDRLIPALPSHRADAVVRGCTTLVTLAEELGWPVVATEQYPRGLGPTVAPLAERLAEVGTTPIEKIHFSACREPEFAETVQPRLPSGVVVAGIEAHVCVLQTVADLQARGHQVFVPADAVASRTDENRANGLDLIARSGAVVTNVESLLFFGLQRAGTDAFRRLAPLIR